MVILGVDDGLTIIVTGVAVAVGTVVHVAEDDITIVTTSPLPKVLFENVVAFVPTSEPFSFH